MAGHLTRWHMAGRISATIAIAALAVGIAVRVQLANG
jgi:hypothetical protein